MQNSRAGFCEPGRGSHEEGTQLMEEARDITMVFLEFTAEKWFLVEMHHHV